MNNTDLKTGDTQIDAEIVLVEFKGHRKSAFLNKNNLNICKGDKVVVQLSIGIDLGIATFIKFKSCKKINSLAIENINYSVIRIATAEDLDKEFLNRYDEPEIIFQSNELAQNYGLEMKVVDAEWQFDRQKLTIFFTSFTRVDFRELVKELARQFKSRIELRQINSREETQRMSETGIGLCGETICCKSFLHNFSQITVEHAKVQNMSNNVIKLSGYCGRLKCCLLFEYEHYEEEMKKYPPLFSKVATEDGEAIFTKVDIFKNTVNLYNLSQKKNIVMEYKDFNVYIKNGKVTPPAIQENTNLLQDIEQEIILD